MSSAARRRSPAARTATGALVITAALAATGVVVTPAAATAATDAATAYLATLNAERVAHGLRPLARSGDLTAVAQRWSQQMADSATLAHNPRLTTAVHNWQVVGENVGEGPTIPSLAAAFWASPHHRDNILDRDYTEVGVATVTRGGVIWITVDFRDPLHATRTFHPRLAHRATAPARPVVREGMVGRVVRRVQRHLHVAADGIFGPVTRHALLRFQRHHGLRPSGVVGRATWRALHL